MSKTKLKVSFTRMTVTNNGEWTGKGEMYWQFLVDDEPSGSRSINNTLKVADGETITLTGHRTVSKGSGEILTVFGSVSEKDNLDRDENATFEDSYRATDGWGVGTHRRNLRDGRLDVTLTYKVERV